MKDPIITNGPLKELYDQVAKLTKEIKSIEDKNALTKENTNKGYYEREIIGNVFYADETTYRGFVNYFLLVKPLSCDNFSTFKYCTASVMEITFSSDGVISRIEFNPKETVEINNLKTRFGKCDERKFEEIKNRFANDTAFLMESLSVFVKKK